MGKKSIPIPFLLLLLLSVVLIVLSEQLSLGLIKPLVQRLRPSYEPALSQNMHLVDNHIVGLYGFVSSCATLVFSIAFYLYFTVRKQIPWLSAILFFHGLSLWGIVVFIQVLIIHWMFQQQHFLDLLQLGVQGEFIRSWSIWASHATLIIFIR